MIIVILVVLGLCFGSFVNALVWRLHEQGEGESGQAGAKKTKASSLPPDYSRLSVLTGRSMCPDCRHELAARDLLPVLSWLSLKGKCRYCQKPISIQYPLVELSLALLFVASYVWWPVTLGGAQTAIFILWLALLVGLLALLVYDLSWMLLPNRIIYPLVLAALAQVVVSVSAASRPRIAVGDEILAVLIGGGVFYILYQVSAGKWIGGGDIRLGWLLGLIAGTPARSFLLIFAAAALGSIISLPLLMSHKLKRNSTIPFGPFLIIAMIVVQLFGHAILLWYQRTFLPYTV
jgi:leader peptidase (prepilin peptidase) / N-methyltransferase